MKDLHKRLLELTGAGVFSYSLPEGILLTADPGFMRIFGLECRPRDILGTPMADVVRSFDGDGALRKIFRRKREVRGIECHFRTLKGDDRWVIYESLFVPGRAGGNEVVHAMVKDITSFRAADKAMHAVNRRLHMVNECSRALFRAEEEQYLLEEVCRIIVGSGGYRMAWVGYRFDDEAKSVKPVASAGYTDGYLEALSISWGDNELGQGPTGAAIRTGKTVVSRDISMNPSMLPWRIAALERGYASSMAAPVFSDRRCIGALSIYSEQPDAFDAEEEALLQQLANNLGFGIASLRSRDELRRMVRRSREREDRLSVITDNMLDLVSTVSMDGVFQYVSPSHTTILGYEPDEMQGRSLLEFLHPESIETVKGEIQKAAQTLMPGSIVTCNRRSDDSYVWIEAFYKLLFGGDGAPVGAVLSGRDISHQKQAERDLQQGLDKLRQGLQAITMALSSALEKRDPTTAGHQRRVSGLACAIAHEMGLPGDRIEGIRIIALLHDIGKIYVPSEILSKPGKLNRIEFEIVKTHSQVGYDILKTIDFPWPVAQSVLQHHERIDGSGYPAGITGNDACLEARIIAIADVVEAMASHRPYRPAVGIDRALEEIVAGKGTLYDLQAVEACVNLFVSRHYTLQSAESC